MMRKLSFGRRTGRQQHRGRRRAARARQRHKVERNVELGFESLEQRWVLASAGSLDLTFDTDGIVIDDYGLPKGDEEIEAVAVQSDGKIVVAGSTELVGGGSRDVTVARYNADGSRDTSFGTGGVTAIDFSSEDSAMDLVIDSLGRIIVVGEATADIAAVRLTSSGAVDLTFGGGDGIVTTQMLDGITSVASQARGVGLQSDGKIVVGGYVDKPSSSGGDDFVVVRYTTSGALDTTFGGGDGIVTAHFGALPTTNSSDQIYDIAIQSDNFIVAVGDVTQAGLSNFGVARFTDVGVLDTTFDTDGLVTTDLGTANRDIAFDVQIETDGQIVVAGLSEVNSTLSDFGVARYNTNGSLDTSFNTAPLPGLSTQLGTLRIRFPFASGGYAFASSLQILPDGDYIVAGTIGVDVSDATNRFGLTRVNPNGTIDANFGFDSPPGGVDEHGYVQTSFSGTNPTRLNDIALQSNGMLVVAGWADFTATDQDAIIARYDLDLGIPPTAEAGGPYAINEPGGSIVLSGAGTTGTGTLLYEWDLDGDSVFGETGGGATRGDEIGVTPTFTATGLDGPSTIIVSLRVTNTTTLLSSTDTATINVLNVAPTATLANDGPVNEGSTATVTFSGQFDPSAADTLAGFRYAYDFDNDGIWELGDGTYGGSVVSDSAVVPASFLADGDASRTVKARILDDDGGFNDYTTTITINNVAPTADDDTFAILENRPNGTVVGTVAADDPGSDILSFLVVGGTGASAFSIDSATGEITVSNSALLDFETSPTLTLDVEVSDGDGGVDTASITINLLNQPSVSGVVFVDVNLNGQYDANEPGIDGVVVDLLDQYGNPVLNGGGDPISAITSGGGFYLFEDLDPGTYQLFEHQPTGVSDGAEELGSLGGSIVGNDQMELTLVATDAFDYAFAELGQQVTPGDAATIGFWQNKHGQALITQGGAPLAAWLTTNFANVFGNTFTGANATGSAVAGFYRDQLFKQTGKKSAGPAKVDAQFMAVALATFFTSENLAGNVASSYGFNVTDTGIGTKIVNVGSSGAAFSAANGDNLTILQLLQATDSLTDQPDAQLGFAAIYDSNGDGVMSAVEANLRTMANSVFTSINEGGGI